MKCKVVELFGLPGCGKSTLVNSINGNKFEKFWVYDDYLRFDKKRTKFRKYVSGCFFAVKHLSFVGFFIKYGKKGSLSLYFKMIRFLSSLETFLKNINGLVVLDQGLTQYIVTIAYHTSNCENKEAITRLYKLFHQLWNYHAVYLKVPKETASSMAKNRGSFYAFDILEDEERLSIYEKWERCVNHIYELGQMNELDVIECIDSSEEIETIFKDIVKEKGLSYGQE